MSVPLPQIHPAFQGCGNHHGIFAGSRCPVIKVHRSSQLADSIFPERISPHGRLCHAGSGHTEQRRVVYDSYPDVHWRFAGSTGGGIKTTTIFVLAQEIRCIFSKQRPGAFRRALPANAIAKASTIGLLGMLVVCCTTFLLCILEPGLPFISLLFEAVSAYSTAGLSTGITAQLCLAAKLVLIFTMYTGRVGAFTLLSLWVERPEPNAHFTEEAITIG